MELCLPSIIGVVALSLCVTTTVLELLSTTAASTMRLELSDTLAERVVHT
jgi:hypothetical protein